MPRSSNVLLPSLPGTLTSKRSLPKAKAPQKRTSSWSPSSFCLCPTTPPHCCHFVLLHREGAADAKEVGRGCGKRNCPQKTLISQSWQLIFLSGHSEKTNQVHNEVTNSTIFAVLTTSRSGLLHHYPVATTSPSTHSACPSIYSSVPSANRKGGDRNSRCISLP